MYVGMVSVCIDRDFSRCSTATGVIGNSSVSVRAPIRLERIGVVVRVCVWILLVTMSSIYSRPVAQKAPNKEMFSPNLRCSL